MNKARKRPMLHKVLSMILALVMVLSLMPVSALAATDTASGSTDFMRIFHLDCGRKYFSVSDIEEIIDALAANHYTHIQLAFGNDGLRFLLDDMSVIVDGKTYSSEQVKTAIRTGNSSLNSYAQYTTDRNELSETEMDSIIKHAKEKGIEVIPMFNAPGHMYTVVKAMNDALQMSVGYQNVSGDQYNVSPRTQNFSIDPTDRKAVAFAEALLTKYVDYFATKGSTMFNMGADESGLSQANYLAYAKMVNEMAGIIKAKNMTPLAYNDGIYSPKLVSALDGKGDSGKAYEFDKDIVICYWTEADSLPASDFVAKGFKILNNTNNWYYVLGDGLYKVWKNAQWGYSDALREIKDTNVMQVKDDDGSVTPIGSVLCVWCDVPGVSYTGYGEKTTSKTNRECVLDLIKTMADNNPDYFTDAPAVKLDISEETGVTCSAVKSGSEYNVYLPEDTTADKTITLKLENSSDTVTAWTSSANNIATVDENGVVTFKGEIGTVTISATVGTETYSITLDVKSADEANTVPVNLYVGKSKKLTVDGLVGDEVTDAALTQDGKTVAKYTLVQNSSVSYTAAASASISHYTAGRTSYDASKLIDGDSSTFYWSNGEQATGKWAKVKFNNAISFDTIRLTSTGSDTCKDAEVQVSVNDVWQKIGTYTGSASAEAFSVPNNIEKVEGIRVYLTDGNNGKWWQLAEIEWGNKNADGEFVRMAASGTTKAYTSITFTGEAVGETSVQIGDIIYKINVTEAPTVEIPITIVDYRADGLLFDYTYMGPSYRYGLVHGTYDSKYSNIQNHKDLFVAASADSDGLYYVDGNGNKVEQISHTRIEQTGPANDIYGQYFGTGNLDNSWSRAGLVREILGDNGMPVYTDAAVLYVASLLAEGCYNEMSGNCNAVLQETFLKSSSSRSVLNKSTTGFSTAFANSKTYANIQNAYDLAWYLLNTLYQPDTNMTTVTGTDGDEHEVPIYGMRVDAYKSIVLTPNDDGTYSFEAGYSNTPKSISYDRTNGVIKEDRNVEATVGLYPLEGLGYEQEGLLTKTSSIIEDGEKNGSFTLRGESQFVYNEADNLYFTFTGDDDVYMYINGVLALDLGGTHGRNTKTVKLNELDKDKYHLTDGSIATFTFFYMERCSDASTFGIETNMELVKRGIDVQKLAYSDTSYKNLLADGAAVNHGDEGSTIAYDLVVTNSGNSPMNSISFDDSDSFGGSANFGFGVTDASVTAGTPVDNTVGLVSLGESGSYTIFVTDKDGNKVGNSQTGTSVVALSDAVAGINLDPGQSLHVRFLTAKTDVEESKMLSYTNTVTVTAISGGSSLTDKDTHTIYSYNAKDTDKTYVVDFGLPVKIENVFDPTSENYIIKKRLTVSQQPQYGDIKDISGEGYNTSFIYALKDKTTIDGLDTMKLSVDYNFSGNTVNLDKTINIIPASTVYYEDSFASFEGGAGTAIGAVWEEVKDRTTQTTTTQALSALGSKDIYGKDEAYADSTMYSMGSAHKVTVNADMVEGWNNDSAWPTATFTFKGTGFDIISLTDNTSGTIFVDVVGSDGEPEKKLFVDNYYGYNQKDDGTWEVDPTANNALYQIPVMKVTDLPYDTYTVTIRLAYSKWFDHIVNNEYTFVLDAIRVYDPMDKDYADYTKDNEGYPQYIKLRDTISANKDLNYTLFIDGADEANIANYANYGPNNEVYLANGQAISFKIADNATNIASIQIGAKAPNAVGANMSIKVNDSDAVVTPIGSATEMYYKIDNATGGSTITIANTGNEADSILSLTNLKITYNNKPAEYSKVQLQELSPEEQTQALVAVRALFAAPEPVVEPFAPERFEAKWNSVRAGRQATLTVKTSTDVESISVNGETVDGYRTRCERSGWGPWAQKVEYREFTYTVKATETTDYTVCAVNADGVSSESITATLTVKPAQNSWWSNWWDGIFGKWF